MKSRFPFVLVLAVLAGCGLTSLAINAYADPVSGQTTEQPSSSDASSSDAPEHFHFSDADRAAFLDARIAALHAGLVLTPAQEKLWPSVESALRETHKVIADQRAARRNSPRPADPVAWLQRASDNTMARGEALKKLADAAGPLYSSLNDDQKNRLPFLLHAAHFHFFGARFAANDNWHGQHDWRGDRGGDDSQGRDDEADHAPDGDNSQ
ncbi:MAG: Spy/CpxP family protein refolding chaperone [Methylovirgula sp.]